MAVLKGWKFPVQIDEDTGRIKTVEDNESIRQSLKLILNTQRNERKIFTDFGTNLRSFMFEVVDPSFVSTLKNNIASSVKKWEKHIRDINVSVSASSGTVSTVESSIDYITDIEPTQERVITKVETNDK